MRTVTLRIQDLQPCEGTYLGEPRTMYWTTTMEHLPIGGWRARVIIAVARLIARRWFFDSPHGFFHC